MEFKTAYRIPASLCIRCRGGKLLCGLSYCPISVKNLLQPKIKAFNGNEIDGSTPPSVFVGRFGYPKVNIYPSAPNLHGDTSIYEDPSKWMKIGLEEFLSMRLSLLRGGMEINVKNLSSPDSTLQDIQLMSLSGKPVEVEMEFTKNMKSSKIILDEHVSPMGPAAPVKRLTVGNASVEGYVDRIYSDTDLLAAEGMNNMYRRGMDVTRISKILSVGALGVKKQRKAVPTRWAITAADKNLSDELTKTIKQKQQLGEFLAYVRKTPGNLFTAILSPRNWMFEWGEAWYPGSTWNQWSETAFVEIDYEMYGGRKDYPGIGGCYYSSKLAALEALNGMQRQGAATLWREIYPGFNLPVGVWYVRENVREMFRSKPERFSSYDEAVNYIGSFLTVPLKFWRQKSGLDQILAYGGLDRYL
ncbi:MAG: Nre family DNA repair protein [Thermoplasmataceae archaeon]